MPRRHSRSSGLDQWAQDLGERISRELGQVIAQSVQRILQRSIDAKDLARKLGEGGAGNGRWTAGKGACTEPDCSNPVLAKGLCRSHYYRERYRALKSGTLAPRRRKGRGRRAETAAVT
jgi:hypothetical protein